MHKVLIIGKSSYIGEELKRWLDKSGEKYYVEIVSSLNKEWMKVDYSKFDVVVNCAGIAHINNRTEDMKELFYSVNRDLAIEIASHVKKCAIGHYVYFSSMNVYGDYVDEFCDIKTPVPTSFYGDSKLQGDLGIRKLADESFKIAVLRPPFVYGRGCKGNYNTISRIAKLTPCFPGFKNKKSMIYIDNLCEFIRMVIDSTLDGYLTPQNKELVSTADLVRAISLHAGKKIWFTDLFNFMIPAIKKSKLGRKAFADDFLPLEMSSYFDFKYCVVDFYDSIRRSEEQS